MNMVSIYSMAIKLLNLLEIAHDAGYVHNDIALDTIVTGQGQHMDLLAIQERLSNCFQDVDLYFNDLSYMTPYIDFKTG